MYPYRMIEGERCPLFLFKALDKSIYQVSFNDYPLDLEGINKVYALSIDCLDTDRPIMDEQVGETICAIISSFLTENTNSIITYVCDNFDNRHAARQRMFYHWYIKYNTIPTHILKKYEVEPIGTRITYYSSIIFCSKTYKISFVDAIYKINLNEMTSYKED